MGDAVSGSICCQLWVLINIVRDHLKQSAFTQDLPDIRWKSLTYAHVEKIINKISIQQEYKVSENWQFSADKKCKLKTLFLLFLQKLCWCQFILFFALTALVSSIYTLYCLYFHLVKCRNILAIFKILWSFYMAKMALRYNTTSSHRVGNIIWLSTCFSADNRGEATNAAPSVATPCYLLIYSTKNTFKLTNTKVLLLSAVESMGGNCNPNICGCKCLLR